jgi:hypothetical protein
MTQSLDMGKVRAAGLDQSFMAAFRLALKNNKVSTVNGRLKTRASINSLAGLKFQHHGRTTSFAALTAVKNGYEGTDLCLRGSDFVKTAANTVYDILFRECPDILPVSNAQVDTGRDNIGDSADVLAACGL